MTWSYYADPRPDIQRLMFPAGRRILDVGCGTGALAGALKAAGAEHVAGIELNSHAAAAARAVVDTLVEGNVLGCPLPFTYGEFDYIVFADVLEHLPDPDGALERCLPYLASDGRVVAAASNECLRTTISSSNASAATFVCLTISRISVALALWLPGSPV